MIPSKDGVLLFIIKTLGTVSKTRLRVLLCILEHLHTKKFGERLSTFRLYKGVYGCDAKDFETAIKRLIENDYIEVMKVVEEHGAIFYGYSYLDGEPKIKHEDFCKQVIKHYAKISLDKIVDELYKLEKDVPLGGEIPFEMEVE